MRTSPRLSNAAVEVAPRRGIPMAVSRSSWERVAMVREAFDQLALAERRIAQPRDRAYIARTRARVYAMWGFGWDAAGEFRAAAAADSSDGSLAVEARRYEGTLREQAGDRAPR
jgi:hypothetical protein